MLVRNVKDYAIFMLDKDGLIASWNSGAENIKGYNAAEIIGKPMDIFIPWKTGSVANQKDFANGAGTGKF